MPESQRKYANINVENEQIQYVRLFNLNLSIALDIFLVDKKISQSLVILLVSDAKVSIIDDEHRINPLLLEKTSNYISGNRELR